jgi:hypothetical protein
MAYSMEKMKAILNILLVLGTGGMALAESTIDPSNTNA